MKKLLITSAILIGLAGAGGAALTQQSGTAEDNTPTRVDQLEGRVDNHEAETDVLRIAHSEAGGWNLGEVHTGKYDKLFVDTYRGKSVSYMLRKQWENGSDWRDKRVAALNYFAQKPANDLQVKQLTDKTVELGKAVDLKQKEVDRLNAELAVQSDDTKLLNGFGEWLQKIIVRLGVKKG